MAKDILRQKRFSVGGTSYSLTIWDTHRRGKFGKAILGYRFKRAGDKGPLFEGEDFHCSPLHSVDGDETISELMGFLTLQPGDTDTEYFDDYTPKQLDFAASFDAEYLSGICIDS